MPKDPLVSPALQLQIKRQPSADGSFENLGGGTKIEGICQSLKKAYAQRPLSITSSADANQMTAQFRRKF